MESELENYKGEITQLRRKLAEGSEGSSEKMSSLEKVEYSLRNQLKEWEKKYETLKKDHQGLLEEKCELEEAENDSRLNAQRWEQSHKNAMEKSNLLGEELTLERKSNSILRSELDTIQANLDESRNEAAYFESLVQRYEQRVFDLEELEVELREKLALLEGALQFALWWNTTLLSGGARIPTRPMIKNYSSEINPSEACTIILESSSSSMDEDWPLMVENLKSEKLRLTQTLQAMMAEKESLAISLEGNHEDKINRIIQLEDKITELLHNAEKHQSECTKEIRELRAKLQAQNKTETDQVPLTQNTEDAYRQTIAEADSLLSKMEVEYETKIKTLQYEKSQLEETVRLLEQSQGYLKNQLAKMLDDTDHKEEMADLSEKLLGIMNFFHPQKLLL